MDGTLDAMVEAARAGGAAAAAHFRRGVTAQTKADPPVTAADTRPSASSSSTRRGLRTTVASAGSQRRGMTGARARRQAPIDGARNLSAVSHVLSDAYWRLGRTAVAAGVVYQPLTGGRTRAPGGGVPQRRARGVSPIDALDRAMLGSQPHAAPRRPLGRLGAPGRRHRPPAQVRRLLCATIAGCAEMGSGCSVKP
jgi:fructose-1,6-bisphosphatase/inositol monophosphatase family enzyme